MKQNILIAGLAILVVMVGYLVINDHRDQRAAAGPSPETLRDLAQTLRNEGLYPQSVETFKRYLERAPLSPDQAARIHYLVGTIQMDHLSDYEAAMVSFYAARQLAPNSDLKTEIGRRLVNCLERSGRSAAAARQLNRETSAAPVPVGENEDQALVVATIDGEPVTWDQVKSAIERLEGVGRAEIASRADLRNLVHGYLGQELLYRSARRNGIEDEPEFRRELETMARSLAVNRLYQDEIAAKVEVSESDLELYYQAHIDRYRARSEGEGEGAPKPFDEVRRQVERQYRREKEAELYQAMIERLIKANKVEMNDEAIAKAFDHER